MRVENTEMFIGRIIRDIATENLAVGEAFVMEINVDHFTEELNLGLIRCYCEADSNEELGLFECRNWESHLRQECMIKVVE